MSACTPRGAATVRAEAGEAGADTGPAGATTRVLIIDDGARAREGLRALLATYPEIEVVATAEDGPGAVELARRTQADVIVLDARLPLMDGLEVTRRIKADDHRVRVIILSFCDAYREAALSAGADAFLVKGGPFEELVGAIRPGRNGGHRAAVPPESA